MHETLRQDQKLRWQKGDRVPVAFYLKQYPELQRDSQIVKSLVIEEMRLRESLGESIDLDDYVRMYPECRDAIESFQSSYDTVDSILLQTHLPEHNHLSDMPSINGTIQLEVQAPESSEPDENQTLLLDQDDNLETLALPPSSLSQNQVSRRDGLATSFPPIPGFEILEEIGRGGMGIVYRAKQISANRIVALKVVRSDQLDMMSKKDREDALNRFTTEAHAAASLQHDNIVAIYEVGEVTDKSGSGIPIHYYAMRFVQGESLFDLVRDGPLDNRRAAKYIHKVANALQSAHDHGILHRDMKPHNVMIEKESDRPLVADFGLAKIVDSGQTMTYAGQVMGTPAYMSPEQATDAAKVTAAADQYSIGATLYHVLTGRPPFVASNAPETIRQILDKQPVSLRTLNSSVHRDLETIVLKSIHKDPSRRYGSCKELADDLQRYLDGIPILARPVSHLERAWRWCCRNPVMAMMAASVAVLVLSTIAAITTGYRNTSAALAISESRLRKALVVVDDLFTRVSEDDLLNEPGMQPLRRDLLEKALKHYEYFLSESGSDDQLADEVAAAHYRVGMIQQVIGDLDAAKRELELARRQQATLWKQRPDQDRRLKALSDSLNALGVILDSMRQPKESLDMFQAALESRNQLAERNSGNPEYQRLACNSLMNIGLLEIKSGMPEKGREYLRDAQNRRISLLKEFPEERKIWRDIARGWFSLGTLAYEENLDEAIEYLQLAVAEFEKSLARDSRSLSLRFECSLALRMLGSAYTDHGDNELAKTSYEKATELVKRLHDSNPDVFDYKEEFAILSMNLASNYEESEQPLKAEEVWRQALRLERELLLANPDAPDIQADIVICLEALGDLANVRGESQTANTYFVEALPMLRGLLEKHPDSDKREMFMDQLRRIEEHLKDPATQESPQF
jgi:tetratricopeptide (TPR) repeat protein/tRNA A-37 threonylcarbamoyl transferase component Bud32